MKSAFLGTWLCISLAVTGGTFRLATYNLENYLLQAVGSRPAKSTEGRHKVVECLTAIQADVLALQEVGGTDALRQLRGELAKTGLVYPHWELITGFDTNIQIAVLSRFPIIRRHPHTNDYFLLMGRRLRVSRGFLEVEIEPTPGYRFTLFTCHLKSRRPVAFADESEMRFKEAEILRQKINRRLLENPKANLVLLGDLNDVKNSRPVRFLVGRGRQMMFDTRPAERNGDDSADSKSAYDPRTVTWTHYYGLEDSYSRIDYILVGPGMLREWEPAGTYVLTSPNWGVGSDHRPIVATFMDSDQ